MKPLAQDLGIGCVSEKKRIGNGGLMNNARVAISQKLRRQVNWNVHHALLYAIRIRLSPS